MAINTTIAERPVPPKGRLSFPMLILRMIANPVASWGEDFYEKPAVLCRWLGLQTLYVMDPVLIQRILLEEAESYSKQPLNDDVFGEAIGGGLLNAEGEEGATIIIPIYVVHCHKLLWQDPLKFDPPRFAPEEDHPRDASISRPFRASRRRVTRAARPHHALSQEWSHPQSDATLTAKPCLLLLGGILRGASSTRSSPHLRRLQRP